MTRRAGWPRLGISRDHDWRCGQLRRGASMQHLIGGLARASLAGRFCRNRMRGGAQFPWAGLLDSMREFMREQSEAARRVRLIALGGEVNILTDRECAGIERVGGSCSDL